MTIAVLAVAAVIILRLMWQNHQLMERKPTIIQVREPQEVKVVKVPLPAPAADNTFADSLLERLADVLDRQQEMIGTIHYYQVKANAPQEYTPANYVGGPDDLSTSPSLYTSEDEGDLRHMAEEGMIEPHELEAALKDMNFLNTEIDFDR